jgi:hypothetical protein
MEMVVLPTRSACRSCAGVAVAGLTAGLVVDALVDDAELTVDEVTGFFPWVRKVS